jgi:hypothetical protein
VRRQSRAISGRRPRTEAELDVACGLSGEHRKVLEEDLEFDSAETEDAADDIKRIDALFIRSSQRAWTAPAAPNNEWKLTPASPLRLLLFGFRSFMSCARDVNRRRKSRALASIPPAATIYRQPPISASCSALRCFSNREGGRTLRLHQLITNQIVSAIEQGAGEFKLSGHRSAGNIMRPVNVASKTPTAT